MKSVVTFLSSLPRRVGLSVVLVAFTVLLGTGLTHARDVAQTNLVSDIPVLALHTDAHLVNPWGLSHGPNTPFWVSDAGTNVSTLYDGMGTVLPLVVSIPHGAKVPVAVPTGNIFNDTLLTANPGFAVRPGKPSFFIFAGATGTISGWNPSNGTHATLMVDNSGTAGYTGIAMGTNAAGTFLFAANFAQGRIDVFDKNFSPATTTGTFTDLRIPAGFAPFNIENIGSLLFVTYALRGPNGRDVAGAGNGFVAVFDTNGALVRHFASGGKLNSPWGMVIAPASFGKFAGDLLVGNFGDGRITAFRLSNGRFHGQLRIDDDPIVIPGLWALETGAGARNADPNKVYFTAGIRNEAHGLFGTLGPAAGEDASADVDRGDTEHDG